MRSATRLHALSYRAASSRAAFFLQSYSSFRSLSWSRSFSIRSRFSFLTCSVLSYLPLRAARSSSCRCARNRLDSCLASRSCVSCLVELMRCSSMSRIVDGEGVLARSGGGLKNAVCLLLRTCVIGHSSAGETFQLVEGPSSDDVPTSASTIVSFVGKSVGPMLHLCVC